MEKSQKNNHFIVVEEGEQKINIVVPSLFHDKERSAILQIILLKRDAVEDVQINSKNNLVEIRFNPEVLSKVDLFDVLHIVLANFSEKPGKKDKQVEGKVVKKGGLVKRLVFSVEGMSCPSCALYLEMTLSRDGRVINASVDYHSKKGVVVGFLELNDVLTIIDGHGYKASCC